MSGWKERPIHELCCAIIDCVNKTAPTVPGPTPYRMIRTTNVRHGRVDLNAVRYVDEPVYRRWVRRGEPLDGDIVLTREAPLGEVGMLRDSRGVFLGQRLVMYRANPDRADRNFLFYAMRSPDVQAQIKAYGSGATVEHMRVPDCGQLRIASPGLPEQRRIGAVLGAIDDLIEVNERQIELLEDLARTVYREWFVRFRFPDHDRVPLTPSPLGLIPSDWRVASLADVARLVMGQSPRSEFYNRHGQGLPFHQGVTDYGPLVPTHRTFSTAGTRVAEAGDILCSVRAPVGRLNVADEKLILGRGLAAIRRHDGSTALALEQVRAALGAEDSVGGGTIYKAVNKDELGARLVVEPPTTLANRFEDVARPMLDLRITLTHANRNLAATRDLLLPRLVTGRLDISNVDLGDLLPPESD